LSDCDLPEEDESADEPQEGESEVDQCARIIAKYNAKANTPLRVIRAFCVSCMGGYVREVARCTSEKTCVMYPMRMGTKGKK
jgi:hypothetical protein